MRSRPGPHLLAPSPDVLAEILRPDVNLCVWQRRLPPELDAWLHMEAVTRSFETAMRPGSGPTDLAPLVGGLRPSAERDALLADIHLLARIFAELAGRPPRLAELSLVGDDSCRKLHADEVGLRLLVTYAGPGTEWAPNDAVVRSALGARDPDVDEANRAIVPDLGRLRRAGTGDVLVMKGTTYLPNDAGGLVHRSPPIEHIGSRRVVLKLCDGAYQAHAHDARA